MTQFDLIFLVSQFASDLIRLRVDRTISAMGNVNFVILNKFEFVVVETNRVTMSRQMCFNFLHTPNAEPRLRECAFRYQWGHERGREEDREKERSRKPTIGSTRYEIHIATEKHTQIAKTHSSNSDSTSNDTEQYVPHIISLRRTPTTYPSWAFCSANQVQLQSHHIWRRS